MLSHIHVKARSVLASLALISGLVLSGSANAGWALIANADNPTAMDGSPPNAGQDSVTTWLNGLIAPDTAGSIIASQDYDGGLEYNGETITLPAGSDPEYLVLHFGGPRGGTIWAFGCEDPVSGCLSWSLGTLDLGNQESLPDYGLSFYRAYGTTTGVPEPATLGLFGLGLLGVGLARRSKKV